ncbi:Immunity protein 43 domain-containing protein [Flavobacterium branchiophilum]|uniref:Immunity protein 43 domain-containing protein n=1 Tax=Flavobacterium branchiophilum (strain FL-15) TaxID=1034807 RepID=G2Z5Q2_FLABF|nr:Imm43 family immunity protein [Flavobacterium branchiophilum]CCB70851.1 Hypothetical protein FBFL15_2898 [Flavobacterium branchiophilum FL-15]
MNDLFIWYNTIPRTPKGFPLLEDRWLREKYYPSKNQEEMDYKWMKYNPLKDAFPPKGDLKLPDELFFIVQKQKELLFDFMNYHFNLFIVSDVFLKLIQEYRLDLKYEISKLKIVHKNEKELKCDKDYYALRVSTHDDDLFDYVEDGKKRASGARDFFLYPNLKLKPDVQDKGIYFLNEFCYHQTIVVNEELKKTIIKNFYSPELYKLEDFAQVYNNSYKLELMPENIR